MFSLVPERLSASQAATQKQRAEARREQDDDYDLKAGARMWCIAKDAGNTTAVNAALAYVDACRDVLAGAPDKKKDLRHARDGLALVARQAQPRVREFAYRARSPVSARRDTFLRVAGHDGAAA